VKTNVSKAPCLGQEVMENLPPPLLLLFLQHGWEREFSGSDVKVCDNGILIE
jgi:hypothetical protein